MRARKNKLVELLFDILLVLRLTQPEWLNVIQVLRLFLFLSRLLTNTDVWQGIMIVNDAYSRSYRVALLLTSLSYLMLEKKK